MQIGSALLRQCSGCAKAAACSSAPTCLIASSSDGRRSKPRMEGSTSKNTSSLICWKSRVAVRLHCSSCMPWRCASRPPSEPRSRCSRKPTSLPTSSRVNSGSQPQSDEAFASSSSSASTLSASPRAWSAASIACRWSRPRRSSSAAVGSACTARVLLASGAAEAHRGPLSVTNRSTWCSSRSVAAVLSRSLTSMPGSASCSASSITRGPDAWARSAAALGTALRSGRCGERCVVIKRACCGHIATSSIEGARSARQLRAIGV